MVIKKIDTLSCGKIMGLTYGAMGFLLGLLFTLMSLAGAAFGFATGEIEEALYGALFGVGAVIVLPLFYGIMGFLFGLISALIYNVSAGVVGGLEIELE